MRFKNDGHTVCYVIGEQQTIPAILVFLVSKRGIGWLNQVGSWVVLTDPLVTSFSSFPLSS